MIIFRDIFYTSDEISFRAHIGIERVRAAHQQVVFFSYGGLLWPQSEISWKPISFHLLGGMGQECEEVGTEVAVLKARLTQSDPHLQLEIELGLL